MSEKPGRRFWRFHLSTAVLLMFVAGALIWNIVRVRSEPIPERYCTLSSRGWPYDFDAHLYASDGFDLGFGHSGIQNLSLKGSPEVRQVRLGFYTNDLVTDVGINTAIVFVIGILLETIIRRRKTSGQ